MLRPKFTILLLIISIVTLSQVGTASAQFSDVDSTHAYAPAIQYLKDKGIMDGYADGTFGINKLINRAEFVAVAMKAAGLQGIGDNCFKDITNERFAPYVCQAKTLGFVIGYKDGYFRPENDITFVDAAAIIVNVFGLKKRQENTKVWYQPYVVALEKNKAIPISIYEFDAKILRGQVAEILWRLLVGEKKKRSMKYSLMKKRASILSNATHDLGKLSSWDDLISKISKKDQYFCMEQEAKAFIELQNVKDKDIQTDAGGIPAGFDDQIAKEIYALASIANAAYASNSSFELLGDIQLFDYKKYVYLTLPRISSYVTYYTLDANSATLVTDSCINRLCTAKKKFFIKDKNNLYEILDDYSIKTVEYVDAASFEPIKISYAPKESSRSISMFKDKNGVYVITADNGLKKVDGIDATTFKIIAHIRLILAKDKNNVFEMKGGTLVPIESVDVDTFEVLHDLNNLLAKDKSRVYAADPKTDKLIPIKGLDAATAEIAGYSKTGQVFAIIRDKNSVFSFNEYSGQFEKLAGDEAAQYLKK